MPVLDPDELHKIYLDVTETRACSWSISNSHRRI